MDILLIALGALGVIAALLGVIRLRKYRRMVERGELEAIPEAEAIKDECCGEHAVCEKDSLLAAVSKEVEYYDDEELDAHRNTPAERYTAETVETFRDIFYTLREEEVAGWVRSLQLRGVELPHDVKEEVYLILAERRIHG